MRWQQNSQFPHRTLIFSRSESLTDQLKSAFCSIAMNSNFPDLPDDGPEIRGGQPRYNIGDTVNVTCISRNSLPAAKLSWYINGEKADPIYLRTYPEETNIRTQLQTSTLGLTFKVNTTRVVEFSKGQFNCYRLSEFLFGSNY